MHGDGLVVDHGDGAVGLHGIVEQRGKGEPVLDDVGALAKRLLGVPLNEVGAAATVVTVVVFEVVGAHAVVGGIGVVHQGASLEGRLHLRHLGQGRIVDLYPGHGLGGRGFAVGHHDGHRLALEPHLLVRQHRAVLHRLAVRLDGPNAPEPAAIQGVVGHDGVHALDLARGFEVEPVNARVRVGTADEFGELHPRDREVRRVDGGSGDFFIRIEAAYRSAHVFHW